MWQEIFRGGKQTDSSGKEHDGDEIIEKAVASFDASAHEPPLTIGHPEDNSPAYGWVEALRKVVKDGTAYLEARFRQVPEEVKEAVSHGLYKKVSISVYPDGRLRHVGLLGGMPPAVKGLAPLGFKDEGTFHSFEFTANAKQGGTVMEKFMEFMEFLKFWKKVEKELVQDRGKLDDPDKGGPKFSEEDVKKAAGEAADKARKQAEEDTRKKVEAEFREAERSKLKDRRKAEISVFVEQGVKEGRLLPAWEKLGLRQFMESLDADESLQFSEGEKGKGTRLSWFRSFLEELPKVVEFKEVADRSKDAGAGSAAEKLHALVSAKMKQNDKLAYNIAFREAQAENPDLAREYLQEIGHSA